MRPGLGRRCGIGWPTRWCYCDEFWWSGGVVVSGQRERCGFETKLPGKKKHEEEHAIFHGPGNLNVRPKILFKLIIFINYVISLIY